MTRGPRRFCTAAKKYLLSARSFFSYSSAREKGKKKARRLIVMVWYAREIEQEGGKPISALYCQHFGVDISPANYNWGRPTPPLP